MFRASLAGARPAGKGAENDSNRHPRTGDVERPHATGNAHITTAQNNGAGTRAARTPNGASAPTAVVGGRHFRLPHPARSRAMQDAYVSGQERVGDMQRAA
jgi:hypothetical protein